MLNILLVKLPLQVNKGSKICISERKIYEVQKTAVGVWPQNSQTVTKQRWVGGQFLWVNTVLYTYYTATETLPPWTDTEAADGRVFWNVKRACAKVHQKYVGPGKRHFSYNYFSLFIIFPRSKGGRGGRQMQSGHGPWEWRAGRCYDNVVAVRWRHTVAARSRCERRGRWQSDALQCRRSVDHPPRDHTRRTPAAAPRSSNTTSSSSSSSSILFYYGMAERRPTICTDKKIQYNTIKYNSVEML